MSEPSNHMLGLSGDQLPSRNYSGTQQGSPCWHVKEILFTQEIPGVFKALYQEPGTKPKYILYHTIPSQHSCSVSLPHQGLDICIKSIHDSAREYKIRVFLNSYESNLDFLNPIYHQQLH